MSYAAKLTKCEAEVARLTAELAAMRERCERLFELAQREHRECEDRWYSCPKSDGGCADERNTGCTCGADSHNRAEVKKQPAKKAKRKAAPHKLYAVTWRLRDEGATMIASVHANKTSADVAALHYDHGEVIAYHREVLPRTRTRKGER